MKIYRNHYGSIADNNESTGFSFHATKGEAARAALGRTPKNGDPESFLHVVNIRWTKYEIVAALNLYASHPDNG